MSGFTRNAVYTRIRSAVLAVNASAFVSAVPVPSPAKFPAVFAREIGRVQMTSGTTLTNDDRPWRDTFEAAVYSNKTTGAMSEAYAIMDAVDACMAGLGYIQDMCQPVDNADTEIYRLVGRWHRTTGGGDQMPNT